MSISGNPRRAAPPTPAAVAGSKSDHVSPREGGRGWGAEVGRLCNLLLECNPLRAAENLEEPFGP